MKSTRKSAVLDANVLFPFSLRDTLLRAAAEGFYQLYWSDEILSETSRNLVETGTVTEAQAEHLLTTMMGAFPEAMVHGYRPLIEQMPNDEKDRHVAAAAVKAGAELIVTYNLKDFRTLPSGIEAQSPDAFLVQLFETHTQGMVALLERQAEALQSPPKTFDELLTGLSKTVPNFVRAVREFANEEDESSKE